MFLDLSQKLNICLTCASQVEAVVRAHFERGTIMEEKITKVTSCSRCAFQRRSPHGGGQKECAITNCNRSANYASKVAEHCPLKTAKYSWVAP